MDTLRISSVIITDSRMRSMHISIPVIIKTIRGNKTVETKVLLDTEAEGLFMDRNYAEEHDIILQKFPNPIIPSNIDGTLNHAGQITHFTWIQAKIDKRKLLEKLWITDLGSSDVIFGLPWFKDSRRITCRSYGKREKSNCQKPISIRLSSILPKMNKGGKRSKKKETNFEKNYNHEVHQKRPEQNQNRPFPETLLSRRNEDQ